MKKSEEKKTSASSKIALDSGKELEKGLAGKPKPMSFDEFCKEKIEPSVKEFPEFTPVPTTETIDATTGKPIVSFEKFCEKKDNGFPEFTPIQTEEEEPRDDGPQFEKSSLSDVYNTYMPLIWRRAKSQQDLRQIVAMVNQDAANNPLATGSTVSGIENRRGKDLGRFAGFQDT